MKHGSGVLDIAGGKGQLYVELAVMGQMLCHVVDPLLRKRGTNVLLKKQVRRIDKRMVNFFLFMLRKHSILINLWEATRVEASFLALIA